MHLDDDQWNDEGPERPHPSVDPWSGPRLDVNDEPSEQLTQDLMSFLTDFRSALSGDVGATGGPGDDNPSGPASKAPSALTGGARHPFAQDESSWEDDPYLGSDIQVAPDWWKASDGRWYAPELHPDHSAPASPGPDDVPGEAADIQAAASRPEQPGRKSRLPLVRPRLGKLGQSPATA